MIKPYHSFTWIRSCLLIISVLMAPQCKKHNKIQDELNPAFNEKIIAFTSGVISSESTVRIILAEDNSHAGETNSPAGDGLFKFKPAIKGQAVWVDKRTLEFRPEENLKSGQKYNVRFNLGKILKVRKELAVFEFNFSIVEQAWSVTVEGYQTLNENDLVWNKIKGVVNTADYIDNEQLKKYFDAVQENRKLNIFWEPGEDRRTFIFTIDSVSRKVEKSKVQIKWDGAPEYSEIKSSSETEIPSLSDYKVLDVKVIQQPEQYIQIMFSDPIKKNQSFDGLIYLDNGTTLGYALTGNIIKAFPSARQTGDAKLTISEGLMNILGYTLKESYVADIAFEVPKPAIRLTGKGVILPSSKGMVFPFEAVNLNAVDVKIIKIYENNIGHFLQVNKLDGNYELMRAGKLIHKEKIILGNEPANLTRWNRFYLDLAKLIEPDQGAIYRIELSFRKQYSMYPCDGQEAAESSMEDDAEEGTGIEYETSYWDSYEEYYDEYEYGYDYDWEERDNPCSSSYFRNGRKVARNILASDIGIIAKAGADQTVFCAITSLVTSGPLSDVEVTLYNYQQQTIGSGLTDNDGFITIPAKEKPYLIIAKRDKQRGYLRIDEGSSLSLGAFDVSGKTIPRGLKAFLYGERGVWRPGDTLFLTCMLEDKQKLLPDNHPVVFELINPKGQLYSRTTKVGGINGFYTWNVATSGDAITGNYNLRVKVGGTMFNKTIKIESIKPNRLKINLTFETDLLSFTKPDVKGDLSVKWLHGAVASNLKSVITVTLTNALTVFPKYPSYQFTDPGKSFESEEETLFEGSTDETGAAKIPGRFSVEQGAPGMLNANFTTRVFENGGDFSIDHFTIPYSPYSSYVGIRTPEGDRRGMLLTDTAHWVDIVLLDEKGTPVSRNNLEASVYKMDWRNWWELMDDEVAQYMGNTYNRPVVSKTFSVVNGKGRFNFRINHPDWGRFYIRVIDPVSRHSAGKIVYLDWPGWAGRPLRNNSEAASVLTFNADKTKYQVGETAEIIIPTGGSGNVLLSIESGSRIISRQWLSVNGKETRHKFQITPEMAPNVYLHVTLIQPHASSENDMPMRLYGVIPILVEDKATILTPLISIPETIEPLQHFSIQISEKSRKEMTYTLAIVEEGLLDLTRFKTPDPWNEFYAREALGVRTWDLYDMVIGAYGGKLASILGIGGDENQVKGEAAEKANRFKPVVKVLGPFTLKEGKTNTHNLVMPNYIGSVRAMVVAGQSGAYGSAEKAVPVKKPLMVLATLPRVLGPGESVKLPVTLFAMDKQVKQVSVTVKTNGLLSTEGGSVKTVNFDMTGEKTVEFDMRVAPKTGVGKVQVIAVSGKNTASYDLELDVRNANPLVTTFLGGSANEGESATLQYSLPGMPGSNSATLEVSGIPPIDVDRRLHYLLNYPHGCVEQITSAVFPQLFLPDIVEFDQKTKDEIDRNIKAGIIKLRSFQQAGGGFSYWPGAYFSSWGSSYAGHFLLEAEKKGYSLPAGLKSAWLKSQKQLARQWTPVQHKNPYYQDDLEQSYRLYTLALAGEPEMSAMNRLRESGILGVQAKWRLAAAYALSGQITVAKELIIRESTEIPQYKGLYSTYGSEERDWAMLVETMILIDDKPRAAMLIKKISGELSSPHWMSTQSTAFCLMAVSKFAAIGKTTEKLTFSYKIDNGKVIHVVSAKPLVQLPLALNNRALDGTVIINNEGKGIIFTRMIMKGIPEAGQEKEISSSVNMEVTYMTRDGKALDISRLTQGTDFMANVTVYNPGQFDYLNMALTQVFPPGWEITNNRLWDDKSGSTQDNTASYQDIRDDRIYTYFDLGVAKRKTFTVQLNATYRGKYYLTGAYCEAMYDNSISAMKKGQWIEVTAAED